MNTDPTVPVPPVLAMDNPSIGFVLLSEGAETLVEEDWNLLSPLFKKCQKGAKIEWPCQILFIYATLEKSGLIRETGQALRDVIREAGASIAVVATETSPDVLTAGDWLEKKQKWTVNLVLTTARHGEAFTPFFYQLFSAMFEGISMPVAWNRLAPQYPSAEHVNTPGTVCLLEAGQFCFRNSPVATSGRVAPEVMSHLAFSFQKEGRTQTFQKEGRTQIQAAQSALGFVSALDSNDPHFHLETALSRLGVLAGYACQMEVRDASRQGRIRLGPGEMMFKNVTDKEGRNYYLGGLLDEFLVMAPVSLWHLIASGIQKTGAQLPDLRKMFEWSTRSMGNAAFGTLDVPVAHQPREGPLDTVRKDFLAAFNLLRQAKTDALYLGWQFALAAQMLIVKSKDVMSPTIAGQIFMEAALIGVKLDARMVVAGNPTTGVIGASTVAMPPPQAPVPPPVLMPTGTSSSATKPSAAKTIFRTILFCRAIERDRATGETRLHEKFESLSSATFPFAFGPFTIRAILENFYTPAPDTMYFNFKHPKTGEIVESLPCRPAALTNAGYKKVSTAIHDRQVNLVRFPVSGEYELELLVGDRRLGSVMLPVHSKSVFSSVRKLFGGS